MKLLKIVRFSSIAALAAACCAQTKLDLRTQGKSVDFSAASYTLPSQAGPVLPATCKLGATFILTSTLAGQNWYVCTSTNQWTVQSSAALPSAIGNAGSVLSTNGSSLLWAALGGDISGAPASVVVNKLLGRPLNTIAPTTGQFLGWDGTKWTAQTLSGSSAVASVFSRTGAITAQSGDYSFSQISGSVASGQLPSSGGDLSGSITSATVARLQGRTVASAAPSTGQVLAWSGSQWAPQSLTGGSISSVFGRTGIVTSQSGDYVAAQVTNAADTTQANSFLAGARQTFSASVNGAGLQVSPGPLPSVPLAGDVAVDSGDSNRVKIYNGSGWVVLNPAIPPGNYTSFFTASTTVSIPGATHNLGTGNLIVQCYDNASPSNIVEPSQITIDPAVFDVTVTFATAETGRCVLNGYNGSGVSSGGSGAGMASQLGDFAVKWNSPSTISIGGNCSPSAPCNVRFGTQVYSVTNPASATVSAGSGMAFIYVDSSGLLNVGSSLTVNCTTFCVSAPGISNFPLNAIPIYTWTASNGAWDSNGGVDRRGWLSASPVLGGPGIAAVSTAGQTTISVDSAIVPTYLTATSSLDFPSIAAGTCSADLTFSLPGANAGDAVAPGWPAGMEAGLSGTMRVSASGIVSVRLCADSTGAVNPAAATFTATVVRGF